MTSHSSFHKKHHPEVDEFLSKQEDHPVVPLVVEPEPEQDGEEDAEPEDDDEDEDGFSDGESVPASMFSDELNRAEDSPYADDGTLSRLFTYLPH